MFDIGAPELFIVAVLAIIVVGPKDLPKLIRSVMGMVRKVKEMGSEFQAGVKKMADEVELDAITRKLNEAGNIDIESTKPDIKPSAEFSDYEAFDYDDYDYENSSKSKPSPKQQETNAPEASSEKEVEAVTNTAEQTADTAEKEVVTEEVPAKKKSKPKSKSKADD